MADHEIDSKNYNQTVLVPTGKTFEIKVNLPDLVIRLHIDPKEASAKNDRYTLIETRDERTIWHERSIEDDMIEGDDYVDLKFTNLRPGGTFSLEVELVDSGRPYFLFQNMTFSELFPKA